jgi:maltose alpha-D-glucosyltransferase/alpha-amylase
MEATTIPTVTVAGGWETLWEGKVSAELERSILPAFLRRQRWFGGKGRRIASVSVADWTELSIGESRVFPLLLEVFFADDKSDLYFFPVGVSNGASAERLLQSRREWAIARLTDPAGEVLLHDALADDDTCLSLLSAIGDKRQLALHSGQIRAFPTAAFAPLRGDASQSLAVERGPATSSNTLIFYGQRLLLKLFRRLEAGINPDFEMGRFLTEGNRFDRLPRVAGAIEYHRADSELITLAILQSVVANEGDGWRHVLGELGGYYARASAIVPLVADDRTLLELAEAGPSPQVEEMIGDYLHAAAALGRRTAQMHRALAADADNADFAPEPFTASDADALRQSIRAQADSSLGALRDNLDRLPPDVASSARRLLEIGSHGLRRDEDARLLRVAAVKIRCHGDYHLGQVLRVENDYVILDFEGEPVRTVAERRAKQSPLKDVAGMLRSYHYAAYAGLFAFTPNRPEEFDRLVPGAELWSQWVSAAFLRAYRAAAAGAAFLPEERETFAALLDAFMLDKAFYELNYELNNRPDWVRIPLRGILTLLESLA